MVVSMERWVGKTAIVTGASAGIGAALVERLIEEGVNVVGVARRVECIEEKAKQLADKKGKLYAVKADLTIEDEILNIFKWVKKELGAFHILINNAGMFVPGHLSTIPNDQLRKILDLNVFALSIATKETINFWKENNIDGHIININSIAGQRLPPDGKRNMYPATKFAVTALTEGFRQELRELGTKVKITSVSPGLVLTELVENVMKNKQDDSADPFKNRPYLQCQDIVDGIIYALSTPPHVQVHELTIKPVGEPY